MAGESVLWVDPTEIPADDNIAKLGQVLANGRHGDGDELMANTAAYSARHQTHNTQEVKGSGLWAHAHA